MPLCALAPMAVSPKMAMQSGMRRRWMGIVRVRFVTAQRIAHPQWTKLRIRGLRRSHSNYHEETTQFSSTRPRTAFPAPWRAPMPTRARPPSCATTAPGGPRSPLPALHPQARPLSRVPAALASTLSRSRPQRPAPATTQQPQAAGPLDARARPPPAPWRSTPPWR